MAYSTILLQSVSFGSFKFPTYIILTVIQISEIQNIEEGWRTPQILRKYNELQIMTLKKNSYYLFFHKEKKIYT